MAATRATVLARVDEIAALLGPACRGHDVLFSTAILKKTGLRIGGGRLTPAPRGSRPGMIGP